VGAAHHDSDLRDADRRHPGLVVEDPAEVLAVREHLVLPRQERAARVDEIDAGEPVLEGDLLRPQVLLHRERVIRAAFHGRVVRDDDAFAFGDPADPGDDAGRRRVVVVQIECRERSDLEEWGARIEQPFDALAGQELAGLRVLVARALGAALAHRVELLVQVCDQPAHRVAVRARLRGGAVEGRGEDRHQAAMLNFSLRARL